MHGKNKYIIRQLNNILLFACARKRHVFNIDMVTHTHTHKLTF